MTATIPAWLRKPRPFGDGLIALGDAPASNRIKQRGDLSPSPPDSFAARRARSRDTRNPSAHHRASCGYSASCPSSASIRDHGPLAGRLRPGPCSRALRDSLPDPRAAREPPGCSSLRFCGNVSIPRYRSPTFSCHDHSVGTGSPPPRTPHRVGVSHEIACRPRRIVCKLLTTAMGSFRLRICGSPHLKSLLSHVHGRPERRRRPDRRRDRCPSARRTHPGAIIIGTASDVSSSWLSVCYCHA